MFRLGVFAAISFPSKIAAERAALIEFNPDNDAADQADADGSPYFEQHSAPEGIDPARDQPTRLTSRHLREGFSS